MQSIQPQHFAFGLITQKQKRNHFCFNYCFKTKDDITIEMTDNNYECLRTCVKKYQGALKLMKN